MPWGSACETSLGHYESGLMPEGSACETLGNSAEGQLLLGFHLCVVIPFEHSWGRDDVQIFVADVDLRASYLHQLYSLQQWFVKFEAYIGWKPALIWPFAACAYSIKQNVLSLCWATVFCIRVYVSHPYCIVIDGSRRWQEFSTYTQSHREGYAVFKNACGCQRPSSQAVAWCVEVILWHFYLLEMFIYCI